MLKIHFHTPVYTVVVILFVSKCTCTEEIIVLINHVYEERLLRLCFFFFAWLFMRLG